MLPLIPLGVSNNPEKVLVEEEIAFAISWTVALRLTPELAIIIKAPVGTGYIPESCDIFLFGIPYSFKYIHFLIEGHVIRYYQPA
jgi:hypothetical protein